MPGISEEQIIALLNLPGVGSRTAWAIVQFAERSGEYYSIITVRTVPMVARASPSEVTTCNLGR